MSVSQNWNRRAVSWASEMRVLWPPGRRKNFPRGKVWLVCAMCRRHDPYGNGGVWMPSAVANRMPEGRTSDRLGEMWAAGPAVCVAPESMMPEKIRGIDRGSRACMVCADAEARVRVGWGAASGRAWDCCCGCALVGTQVCALRGTVDVCALRGTVDVCAVVGTRIVCALGGTVGVAMGASQEQPRRYHERKEWYCCRMDMALCFEISSAWGLVWSQRAWISVWEG